MKTVGVIGGMGPKATVEFLNKVISLTPAEKDQEHLNIIVYINPQIPDRTEAILKSRKNPVTALIDSAKLLENAGVHFIVIPCVTAHFWLKDIQNSVNIPILSLLEVILRKIKKQTEAAKNIGILATTGTIQSKIFDQILEPEGYKIIVPREDIQTNYVMKGIYDIKMGKAPEGVKSMFVSACKHLIENAAQIIIAACSEIPLSITGKDIQVPLIDVVEVLAEKTVRLAFEFDVSSN